MQDQRELKMWEYLNAKGISTEEELNQAVLGMDKLDISCMTAPVCHRPHA